SLCSLVYFVVDGRLIAEDLCKTFYIVAGPAFVHFSIAAELTAHKIVRALDACDGESVGLQGDERLACDGGLCIFQEFLDVAHGRVEHLSFMEPVTIPGA